MNIDKKIDIIKVYSRLKGGEKDMQKLRIGSLNANGG